MELINITLFNEVDWLILTLVICLIVWGMARGFTKMLTSFFLWLIVLIASQILARTVQGPLGQYINDPELALLLPFAVIFFFLFVLINIILSIVALSHRNITSPLTRLLGGIVSLPLLVLQCVFVIQIVRLLTLDESYYWVNSQLIPYLEQLEVYWNIFVLQTICQDISPGLCAF